MNRRAEKIVAPQQKKHELRVVLIAGAVLALIIMINAFVSVYSLRQNSIESRARQLETISLVLAEHTLQTIFSATTALDSVFDAIQAGKVESEEAYRSFASQFAQQRMLTEKTSSNPILDVASLTDSTGRVLNFSRSFPPPSIDLSDRDYFQWFRDNDSNEIFYSVPVQNKGNGKWVFYLARRINNANHDFLGVALVGVSSEVFSRFYEQVGRNLGDGATLLLYRSDYTLLTRWPFIESFVGKRNLTSGTKVAVDAGKTNGEVHNLNTPRMVDGARPVSRMVSARVVEGYPFIVAGTVTAKAYEESWQQNIGGTLFATLASLFILGVGMRMLVKAKKDNAEIQHLAHHDALTGLPNRLLFADRLEHALADAKRNKSKLALAFIDIDRFKEVNDNQGHEAGDQVLKKVAERLRACVRDSDTISRVGGDEFVLLLPDIGDEKGAIHVAEKIRAALNQEFLSGEQDLMISVSIGISIYPDHGKTEAELARHADLAMYASKSSGRNRVNVYNDQMA